MRILLILITLCISTTGLLAQNNVGIKTNLLYGAGTFTPNLGLEVGLGERTTLDISAGYNWFNLNGTPNDNKKLIHWMVQPELRYWLCQKFNGHFFGLHALGSQYNISQHDLPFIFGKDSEKYRYEGWAVGAGLSYGYQFILGKRWNLEMNIGVGYARLRYDQYECKTCGDKVGSSSKNYFGPTKAGISLIYIIK